MSFSQGWLQKFKTRFRIEQHLIHGESGALDMKQVEIERTKLKEVTKDYKDEDIYNCDETAVFFRLAPNKTLGKGGESAQGRKVNKDRMSLMFTANATGDDKLRPLVIHKFKTPRSFGHFKPDRIVDYYYNTKAWMTAVVFGDWLTKWDKYIKLKSPNRKILLLLDSAKGHIVPVNGLTKIKVHFLPPNMTCVLQPLDAGIIRAFKAHYKRLLIAHFLESLETNDKIKLPSNLLF